MDDAHTNIQSPRLREFYFLSSLHISPSATHTPFLPWCNILLPTMKPSSIFPAGLMALVATTAATPIDATNSSTLYVNFTPDNATTPVPGLFNSDDPITIPHMPCAWCQRRNAGLGFTWEYKVFIQMVPKKDWGHLCHNLWQGLKRHQGLCMVSKPHCGKGGVPGDGFDDILLWTFQAGLGCNAGAVASGFWEATHNKFGAMDQRACK